MAVAVDQHVADPQVDAPRTRVIDRIRGRSEGWPILALLYGYPILWLLGIGPFFAIGLAIPLACHLALRQRLVVPRGVGLYIGFLGVVLLSIGMLRGQPPGTLPSSTIGLIFGYSYRLTSYVSVIVVALYVANSNDEQLPRTKIMSGLALLFCYTVVGGYLGLLFTHFSFGSPAEWLLPKAISKNDFVREIVHPGMAQIQTFLGYSEARPKAPFAFTNEWGAVMSMVSPFFVLWMMNARKRWQRWGGAAVLIAALPPIILSLNRGLWIGLIIATALAIVHLFRIRAAMALISLAAVFGLAAGVFFVSPLYGVLQDRLAHPHSDEGRSFLYTASIAGAKASPLVGWGGPRAAAGSDQSIRAGKSTECPKCGNPPVGTHGTFWTVTFSQGFLGVTMLLSFLGTALWRIAKRRDAYSAVIAIVIATFMWEMFVYDQVPVSFFLVALAIGLAWRSMYGACEA